MIVIGIVGGVASGKSLVTNCFRHFGAQVLDGDRAGHEVLTQPEVISEIVSRWGKSLLNGDQIDRQKLAAIVFSTEPDAQDDLTFLEQLTHPRIGTILRDQLARWSQDDSIPAAVLDAPLMFKVGWDQMCDRIVFVQASLEQRNERAIKRGWEPGELARREARQLAVEQKRARSTDIIDNSGCPEETYQAALTLWQDWQLPVDAGLEFPSTLIHV